MTAHELARVLLAGPDVPVVVNARVNELANGHGVRSVKVARMYLTFDRPDSPWMPEEYGTHEPEYDGAVQDVVDLESGGTN